MSSQVVVYVLTALAAVVVVLTRVRLGRADGAARRIDVGRRWLAVHTGAGALALVLWLVFLVAPGDTALGGSLLGVVALGLWWVVSLVGLLILARWLPSKGKHAQAGTEDTWSTGPGLSVLAHGGMVVGVAVFTWAYWSAVV